MSLAMKKIYMRLCIYAEGKGKWYYFRYVNSFNFIRFTDACQRKLKLISESDEL